jgi:hypothetical protein
MPDIAGLKLIVPTSVAGSGVSVSASGKVTFTAATTININGCFTSSYDNYLIVFRSDDSANGQGFYFRMRLSGTDATGTNYTFQELSADNNTVAGSRTSSANYGMSHIGGQEPYGVHMYFYGPALAQPTARRSVAAPAFSGAAPTAIYDHAVTHSLSTAYDGLTLYPSSGTATGALCVYGLAQ